RERRRQRRCSARPQLSTSCWRNRRRRRIRRLAILSGSTMFGFIISNAILHEGKARPLSCCTETAAWLKISYAAGSSTERLEPSACWHLIGLDLVTAKDRAARFGRLQLRHAC